jgi:hypothetical protein
VAFSPCFNLAENGSLDLFVWLITILGDRVYCIDDTSQLQNNCSNEVVSLFFSFYFSCFIIFVYFLSILKERKWN